MVNFSTQLSKLEARFVSLHRTSLMRSLGAGLPTEAIHSVISDALLNHSDEIDALYAWHNGTAIPAASPLDDYHVFPGFYFPPIEQAVRAYRRQLEDPRWNIGWLPILSDGAGDYFIVDLANEGVVRHFRNEQTECPEEYSSIQAMIETWIPAIDARLIYVDQDGYLEMNDHEYGDLAGRLNPGVDWWRS